MAHVTDLFNRLRSFEDIEDDMVGEEAFHRASFSLGLGLNRKDTGDAFAHIVGCEQDKDATCCEENTELEKRRFNEAQFQRFFEKYFPQHYVFSHVFNDSLVKVARGMNHRAVDVEHLSQEEREALVPQLLSRRLSVTEAMRHCDALKLKLLHMQQNLQTQTWKIYSLEDSDWKADEDLPFVTSAPFGQMLQLRPDVFPGEATELDNDEYTAQPEDPCGPGSEIAMEADQDNDPEAGVEGMWQTLFTNYQELNNLKTQEEKFRKHLSMLTMLTEDESPDALSRRSSKADALSRRSSKADALSRRSSKAEALSRRSSRADALSRRSSRANALSRCSSRPDLLRSRCSSKADLSPSRCSSKADLFSTCASLADLGQEIDDGIPSRKDIEKIHAQAQVAEIQEALQSTLVQHASKEAEISTLESQITRQVMPRTSTPSEATNDKNSVRFVTEDSDAGYEMSPRFIRRNSAESVPRSMEMMPHQDERKLRTKRKVRKECEEKKETISMASAIQVAVHGALRSMYKVR